MSINYQMKLLLLSLLTFLKKLILIERYRNNFRVYLVSISNL